MSKSVATGFINSQEAYSKQMVLERLGISQRSWDKMLDEGLSYTSIGHTRWVTGQDFSKRASQKQSRMEGDMTKRSFTERFFAIAMQALR